jgi:hypothetical protein
MATIRAPRDAQSLMASLNGKVRTVRPCSSVTTNVRPSGHVHSGEHDDLQRQWMSERWLGLAFEARVADVEELRTGPRAVGNCVLPLTLKFDPALAR